MKSVVFLTVSVVLLLLGIRSCGWQSADSNNPEVKAYDVVRRPGRRSRSKVYPMAQAASPQALKQAALAEMPSTQKVLESAQGEYHFAPPALMDGLETFGNMVTLARSGGENAEVAASFFKQCAQSNGAVDAVRSVCLRHFLDLKGADAEITNVPYPVRRIAQKLPSILRPQ